MNEKGRRSRLLEPGEHYGEIRRQSRSPQVTLSEVEYASQVEHSSHGNQNALLVFVKRGAYQKTVGRAHFSCGAGDLLFVPAQHVQADLFGDKRTLCLIADCSTSLVLLLKDGGADLSDAAMFSGSGFDGICGQLQQELRTGDAFSALLIEGLIIQILATRSRHQKRRAQSGPTWLNHAKELLHGDVSQVRSIGTIAEQVGAHPAHLASQFRKHFRCSPGEYLRQNRVEQAASLLRQTKQPISEVALACGFSDQAHLSRLFSKHYGATPFSYRRSFQSPKNVQNL